MSRLIQITAALIGSTLLACGQPAAPGEAGADAGYAAFRAGVYQEPRTGVFIVDGDVPIVGEQALRDYYDSLHPQPGVRRQGLTGRGTLRWSEAAKRNLRYCISKRFGDRYEAVRSAMADAAADWSGPVDVRFVHDASQDDTCSNTNTNVTFDVAPISGATYRASAFFPNHGRALRTIQINSSSFGDIAPVTLAGVLRHELGHALGFLHEHSRPEANAPASCIRDTNLLALTSYDSDSVMHYRHCNGTNRGDMVLTSKDIEGAGSVYGFNTTLLLLNQGLYTAQFHLEYTPPGGAPVSIDSVGQLGQLRAFHIPGGSTGVRATGATNGRPIFDVAVPPVQAACYRTTGTWLSPAYGPC